MDDLVHQGKVLYWGTSEWSGEFLRQVHALCGEKNYYRPQVEQPQYNLLERSKFETETRDVALRHGMGLVVWSPLASGLLTGKYDEGFPAGARLSEIEWLREGVVTEESLKKVRRFKALADELGCTRAQLALAWLLRQEGISSVITGATRVEQLRENLRSLAVKIPAEINRKIEEIFPRS
jgi:aryl-alcohol dehydrogenase-like predicted oxidoreductase